VVALSFNLIDEYGELNSNIVPLCLLGVTVNIGLGVYSIIDAVQGVKRYNEEHGLSFRIEQDSLKVAYRTKF
jgi:hypothetical protein